jgi:integrase
MGTIEKGVTDSHQGRGIVQLEANFGEPSKGVFESMARRRFQSPEPKREGKWWYLLYWQDEFIKGSRVRRRKRAKLAPAAIPEREVKKIAAEFLRPANQGLVTFGSAMPFGEFVESIYIPTVLPLMAQSTQERYEGVIENYLKPAFGTACLRDMSTLALQRYFSGMASSKLSYESRDKIRDVVSSILCSAVRYGFLVKNPIEGIKLPPDKKGRRTCKPFIDPTSFHRLVELIPEPSASMVFVAVFTGLRVSELIGLRWRNVHSDSITIAERYCRGDWGAPKSVASNATIAVNKAVIDRLDRLKDLTVLVKAGRAVRRYRVVKSDKPDDLVFQSVMKGAPMRDNSILVRFIKPAARKLGIGWVNWLCLRRSHATWLKMAGADVKDAQAQMRHSRASTTLDIYQQFVPESQRRVVERLTALAGSAFVN